MSAFLSSWKFEIFNHSFSLTAIQCFESQFMSAEAVKLIASPVEIVEIVDNTEAQC